MISFTKSIPSIMNSFNNLEELEVGQEDLHSLKSKKKRMGLMDALNHLSMDDLIKKVKQAEKQVRFLSTETSMFERYLEDKIHSSGSGGGSDESSSGFGSQTAARSQTTSPTPYPTGIIGVARKVGTITTDQKYLIARYYIMILKDELKVSKKTAQHFISLHVALLENYSETLLDIPIEKHEMELEFNYLINAKSSIPFLHKWQKYVTAKNTKKESLICLIKLRNTSLVNKIKKLIMIKKYRDEVDPIEFYSKWTEKRTLIEEIQSLNKHKSRLRRALVPIERYAYEKKQELENNVKQGEEFRKKILRENNSLAYLSGKHFEDEAGESYEKVKNKRLKELLENYRVPSILDYVVLVKGNKEWKELIEKWKQKVKVAEMVYRGNLVKWNNIVIGFKKLSLKL